ncbi:hypothetical protein L6164_002561 [Bauhinia variegata]|uniref:Uncharacterized protein n=1 Tax=Bauhinia variegata TaxID=167791 RepID=A0ACB9PYR8_BAUVA|nr:hypothetical protein L6164_002561 [Bauhinia variegata]
MYCDSHSAICLAKNPTFHSRTKHIDVKYHWIREAIQLKQFSLEKVHANDNGLDMLTKILPLEKFATCEEKEGLVVLSPT